MALDSNQNNTRNIALKLEIDKLTLVTAPMVIACTDAMGEILMINPAARQIFRRLEGEMEGHNFLTLIPELDLIEYDYFEEISNRGDLEIFDDDNDDGDEALVKVPVDYNYLERFIYGRVNDNKRSMIRTKNKNGNILWLELSISKVEIDCGDYFIIIANDITENKLNEEKIIALNASLEKRVIERTKQLENTNGVLNMALKNIEDTHIELQAAHQELGLTHQKLALQNENLRQADELRKDVEQIYRHDLKSPIAGIIGYSEMSIKRKDLPADIKEDFQMIKDSADKVFQMINLSLVIFKIEQGNYQRKKEPVEIIALLITIRADVKAIKKNTISILLDDKPVTNDDKVEIEGEDILNYSLFSNIIKNALEASPDNGDITVTIRVESDYVGIAIHNYGTVPVEIREKFFDKYVTSGKKSGTGLGTYSSKLMVEAQGGSIALDSSGDKGTTITVVLDQYKPEGDS